MEGRTEGAERQEKFHRNKAQKQRRNGIKPPEHRAAYRQSDTYARAAVSGWLKIFLIDFLAVVRTKT